MKTKTYWRLGAVAWLILIWNASCGGGPAPSPSPSPSPPPGFDCATGSAGLTGLVKVQHPIKDRYIVVLKPMFRAESEGWARTFATRTVGLRDVKTFSAGFIATADAQALRDVLAGLAVQFVQQDGVKSINTTWGLDRIDQRNLPLNDVYEPGAAAPGVHAYVIDTGVNASSEFGARLGEGFSVFGGAPTDGHGHGSHVAGTVGGSTWGVAKAVTIHGVKVLSDSGSGSDSGVIQGIDWVTQHVRANRWPAVANMSLGGSASPALDMATCRSIAAGVTYAIAAGNDGADACSDSPGRVAQAVTVGASDRFDNAASFSNDGPCLDLYAPGVAIESIGGLMNGTSMASPHVAGVAALCLERQPAVSAATCVLVNATLNKVAGQLLLYARE